MKFNKVVFLALLLVIPMLFTGCTPNTGSTPGVDIDLTRLNSNMLYSEVFNILTEFDKNVGKVIRVTGPLVVYTNQDKTQIYPVIEIYDSTACCSIPMYFTWSGHEIYNNDFPANGTSVTVTGTLSSFTIEGTDCYCLSDSELTFD